MNRYKIQKHNLQWILSEPGPKIQDTLKNDDRVPLFERMWDQYLTKRSKRRERAEKKLRNIFLHLVISIHSFDDSIEKLDCALNYFWIPVDNIKTPLTFKKYRFMRTPSSEPQDSHIVLFDDLVRETKQRGMRGCKAKEKLKNLFYRFFYLVHCRKSTYDWLKNLLEQL